MTDIKVDPKTGKVYFATFDGIVVYQGDVINVSSDFSEIKFPKSSRYKSIQRKCKITGLAEKTNIKLQMQQET